MSTTRERLQRLSWLANIKRGGNDTQGNPSETFNFALLSKIKREWQHQLGWPYFNPFALTPEEMDARANEDIRIRRILYPTEGRDTRVRPR